MTDLKKEIYEYIQSQGKATMADIKARFNLSETELNNQFAILRHCQLLKGKKEGDTIYIVLW